MRDNYSNVLVEQNLFPATVQASAVNSGNIDTRGFDSLTVVVAVGDIADALSGTSKLTLKIEHADDDGTGSPASYAACADTDVLGFTGLASGVFKTIDADTKDKKAYPIGYVGGKRFVKVTATPASLSTGGPVGILSLKGHPAQAPVAQTV